MYLRYALFDLDDTLYAPETGVWTEIRARIVRYMIEKLNIAPDTAQALRAHYYEQYGTAFMGLRHEYHLNEEAFLAYVHDLPLETLLQPDPALNGMLARLPLQKVIFTNSDVNHSERVLNRLGIRRHFTRIIDTKALGYISKPNADAYTALLTVLNAAPEECIYLDDALRNLRPAQQLGMTTVYVSREGLDEPMPQLPAGADYQIATVHQFERVLGELHRRIQPFDL